MKKPLATQPFFQDVSRNQKSLHQGGAARKDKQHFLGAAKTFRFGGAYRSRQGRFKDINPALLPHSQS